MWLNLMMAALVLFTVAGCATTRGSAPADQTQARVIELEKQLEDKDIEIAQLKDDVTTLSDEVKRKSSSVSDSDDSGAGYKKEGVIRVNVSVQKVQLALQNAGHYSGAIDGKLGGKTKSAIAEFQKANDLNPDGIVGRKTWDRLKTYLN